MIEGRRLMTNIHHGWRRYVQGARRRHSIRALERIEEQQGRPNDLVPYPKLEFLAFHGEEPKEWSSKCEQYFRIYQLLEPQWVEIATTHFSWKARSWKEGYLIDNPTSARKRRMIIIIIIITKIRKNINGK